MSVNTMKWKNSWFVTVLFALLMSLTVKADTCYYSTAYETLYPLGQSNAPTVIHYVEPDANPALLMVTVLDQSPAWIVTATYEYFSGVPARMHSFELEHTVTGNPYPQKVKSVTTHDLCNDINSFKRIVVYVRRASDNALVYRGIVSLIN